MTTDANSPLERLIRDAEIDTNVEAGVTDYSAEVISRMGLIGITTLYTEALRIVDAMPHVKKSKRLGQTALGEEALDLLTEIDQSIELGSQYDIELYIGAKRATDWSRKANKRSPKATLTGYSVGVAECGLGSLYNAVLFNGSKTPDSETWQWLRPDRVIRIMKKRAAVDAELMNKLSEAQKVDGYSKEDNVRDLLGVAQQAATILETKEAEFDHADFAKGRNYITACILLFGGEEVLLPLLSLKPTPGTFIAGAVVAFGGVKLANRKHQRILNRTS